jgi:phosphatidate cytidylyltransferase
MLVALFALAVTFWLVAAPAWLWKRPPRNAAMVATAGVICLVPAVCALVSLREQGAWTLLALMAIVWISDTAAYLTGRRFGRRKLAPAISPGKTWEGFWGAMVAVAIYSALVAVLVPGVLPPGAMFPSIGAALALAVLGVEGDLYESQLKRAAGVKDSGKTLPGHGGVLDRIDALLPLLPAAALLFAR